MTQQEQVWLENLASGVMLRGEKEIERLRNLKDAPRAKMVRILGEDWLERTLAYVDQLRAAN